ncbi:MAG: hypothetical protein QG656_440 [Candidatus Hydrogenedentes bacterium]|nr:hypothetical protein [Candidatus Hydrogenedentota bacterium]
MNKTRAALTALFAALLVYYFVAIYPQLRTAPPEGLKSTVTMQFYRGADGQYRPSETAMWQAAIQSAWQAEAEVRYKDAEMFFKASLDEAEKLENRRDCLNPSWHGLAGLYLELGRYTESDAAYKRVFASFDPETEQDNVERAHILNGMAWLRCCTGQYEDAIPLAERSIAVFEKNNGEKDEQTMNVLHTLATAYVGLNRNDEAEALFLRCMRENEEMGRPQKSFLNRDLGTLYARLGRLDEAEALCKRGAELLKMEHFVPRHPEHAREADSFAILYAALGRFEEAEVQCLESLAIRGKAFGPDHPATATTLRTYADVLEATSRTVEAQAKRSLADRIEKRVREAAKHIPPPVLPESQPALEPGAKPDGETSLLEKTAL